MWSTESSWLPHASEPHSYYPPSSQFFQEDDAAEAAEEEEEGKWKQERLASQFLSLTAIRALTISNNILQLLSRGYDSFSLASPTKLHSLNFSLTSVEIMRDKSWTFLILRPN